MPRRGYWPAIADFVQSVGRSFSSDEVVEAVRKTIPRARAERVKLLLLERTAGSPFYREEAEGPWLEQLGPDLFRVIEWQPPATRGKMSRQVPAEWRLSEAQVRTAFDKLRLENVGTDVPLVRGRADGIGRLPTGQYVILETVSQLSDSTVWSTIEQVRQVQRAFSEASAIAESNVLAAVVADTATPGAMKALEEVGIGLVTSEPEPNVAAFGAIPRVRNWSDLTSERVFSTNWLVVGMTGSGKTSWARHLLDQALSARIKGLVVGDNTEYGFRPLPPRMLDRRLIQLADGVGVSINEYAEKLSPTQRALVAEVIGSDAISYAAISGAPVEKLVDHAERADAYPTETKDQVGQFIARLAEDVEELLTYRTQEQGAVGLDIMSIPGPQRPAAASAFLEFVHRRWDRRCCIIDPAELVASAGAEDESPADALQYTVRTSRKRGATFVLVSQRIHADMRWLLGFIGGFIVFRLTDAESLEAISETYGVPVPRLASMSRNLKPGQFILVSQAGIEGIFSKV